jgi:hypothetical protein
VDDCIICGEKASVIHAKEEMKKRFDCDEVGELAEYVGCKVDHSKEEGWINLTQPVLMQSYVNEFDLTEGEVPRTPATPGSVLQKVDPKDWLSDELQSKYRLGIGKLLHMMKWMRPEILNAVRELSRFMAHASLPHLEEMYPTMKYCIGTQIEDYSSNQQLSGIKIPTLNSKLQEDWILTSQKIRKDIEV